MIINLDHVRVVFTLDLLTMVARNVIQGTVRTQGTYLTADLADTHGTLKPVDGATIVAVSDLTLVPRAFLFETLDLILVVLTQAFHLIEQDSYLLLVFLIVRIRFSAVKSHERIVVTGDEADIIYGRHEPMDNLIGAIHSTVETITRSLYLRLIIPIFVFVGVVGVHPDMGCPLFN
jgi:hypothetical protein